MAITSLINPTRRSPGTTPTRFRSSSPATATEYRFEYKSPGGGLLELVIPLKPVDKRRINNATLSVKASRNYLDKPPIFVTGAPELCISKTDEG